MRFKLVVMPDGKAILTTEEPLNERLVDSTRGIFREWHDKRGKDVLIMGETKVVQVVDVELDLPGEGD